MAPPSLSFGRLIHREHRLAARLLLLAYNLLDFLQSGENALDSDPAERGLAVGRHVGLLNEAN